VLVFDLKLLIIFVKLLKNTRIINRSYILMEFYLNKIVLHFKVLMFFIIINVNIDIDILLFIYSLKNGQYFKSPLFSYLMHKNISNLR